MDNLTEEHSFFANSSFFLKFIDDDGLNEENTRAYGSRLDSLDVKIETYRADSSSADLNYDETKIYIDSPTPNAKMTSVSAHRSLPRHKEPIAGGSSPLGIGTSASRFQNGSASRDDSSVSRSTLRQPQSGSSYELSSDFQQKQMEILERKYGGGLRAKRAAVIIQRAYRKYAMVKKFEHLRKRRNVIKMISSVDILNGRTTFGHRINSENTLLTTYDDRNLTAPLNETAPKLIGRQSDSVLNGVGGARLKLHKYNVNGRTHMSAPLSAQLRAEQIQSQQQNRLDFYETRRNQNQPDFYHNQHEMHQNHSEFHQDQSEFYQKRVDFHSSIRPSPPTMVSSVVRVKLNDCGSIADSRNSTRRNNFNPNQNYRSISTERNQYSACLNLAPTPPIKILSNESEILNAQATSPTTEMTSYASLMNCDRKNSSQFIYSPTSTTTGVVDHRQFFHPTVKLNKKSPVYHTNSADSVQELCTPSSDSGVSCNAAEQNLHRAVCQSGSADNSPRRLVVFKNNGAHQIRSPTPVWLPRQDRNVQLLDSYHTSSVTTPSPADDQEPSCSSSSTRILNKNPVQLQQGIEPKLNWSRRNLAVNSSLRRTDVERKRQYRIALNFFNKKPDRGVNFLIKWNFVEGTPLAVAKFLLTRKGVSKHMIGEYLGNLQNSFNMAVLDCFVSEVNLHNMEIDSALRQFQSLFRLPGEAQKIERIVEVFARRYCECNPDQMRFFKQSDTIFILSFAIIMLNTDLHSPNIKSEKRMKVEDFLKNLRGIDGGADINAKFLTDVYNRVKENEFKPGSDHVTQVLKVERSVEGKKPTLALPHRRLVCYCRLYEVMDPAKKQPTSAHQREVFLFNDMLMITKILSKKKSVVVYSYRRSHCLVGMQVQSFRNQHFANGLRINHTLENKILHFNARNEEDRTKFVEDLHEAILESDEMEALRINMELEKQNYSSNCRSHSLGRNEQQRDSGLADLEPSDNQNVSIPGPSARKKPLSNSLLDVVDGGQAPANQVAMRRRASGTSLDSGMSSTASIGSRESSPINNQRHSKDTPVVDQIELESKTPLEAPKSAGVKNGGFSFAEFFGGKKQTKNQDS